MKNNFDLLSNLADDIAKDLTMQIDFELWYSPTREEYELALDLNAGKKITDKRTKGAKMLKKLKEAARADFSKRK